VLSRKSELIKLAAAKVLIKEAGIGAALLWAPLVGWLGSKYYQAQQSQSQIPFSGFDGLSSWGQDALEQAEAAREEAAARAVLPASRFIRST